MDFGTNNSVVMVGLVPTTHGSANSKVSILAGPCHAFDSCAGCSIGPRDKPEDDNRKGSN